MKPRSLQAQIAEVRRELEMRRKVYPRQVIRHMMRQGEADEQINLMENVLATLIGVQSARLVTDIDRELDNDT